MGGRGFAIGHDERRHELTPEERQKAAEARREQAARLRQARETIEQLPILERREVVKLAAVEAVNCLGYLVRLRDDEDAPHFARLRATELLLQYGDFAPARKAQVHVTDERRPLSEYFDEGSLSARSQAVLEAMRRAGEEWDTAHTLPTIGAEVADVTEVQAQGE